MGANPDIFKSAGRCVAGMRVALAYMLAPFFGETGIWVAIPIGWVMADVTGILYMRRNTRKYNKYNKE